jgi:Xaa-Pro aminopeptidase
MSGRLEALRALLAEVGVPELLVSNPVNVAYLTGFTGTSGYALVSGSSACLLTDFRYLEQAAAQVKGFEVVDVGQSAWGQVKKLLVGDKLSFEAEHLTFDAYRKLEKELEGVELEGLSSPVGKLRRVKDGAELAAIEAAVALGDEAFRHILGFIRVGVEEREIALELEYFMRRRGASGTAFDIIVASGARSALPHGVAGEKRLEAGDAVVLDLGCVLDYYCSDMTRTVFIGEAGEEERMVYREVLAAQLAALAGVRAGMTGKEADALARDCLMESGLAQHFGHGLGHGLGREVHESPRLSPPSEEVLQAGMVVTVEPGVYLPGKFGVRIEDVVVIGEEGCRNLTGSTKELICL